MKEQSDKVFIRNFSLIVVALILFTVSIVFLAKYVGFEEERDIPSRAGLTEERIRPVADVYTAEDSPAATQEAAPEVAAQETAPEAATQETAPVAATQEAAPAAATQETAPVAATQEAAPAAAPAQAVASDSSLEAEKTYNSACAACHATGLIGAPIPGSAEMAQRAEAGLDAMWQNSLNGLNAMPARGGRPDLSDEQIKAIVEFMIK
ncbi:MAG: hypothetical protein BMS9Abin30_1248 [Gammaproteobacteria bacterium]|nr:MAG: hypothetical protein BMS9Abin30_1248 [Gammaproteobacteria bacterium]